MWQYTDFWHKRHPIFDTESMKEARRIKKAACILRAVYSGPCTAHYRSRHKIVGSMVRCDFEHFFV